jgi:pimeloyl-ACP methyl ester carboxylesterase
LDEFIGAVMSEDVFPGPALRPLRLQFGEQIIAGFESPGTGRQILLIHGNSSSSRIWQKQLQGPLGAKYRLIAIDLAGHGASLPAPIRSRTIQVQAIRPASPPSPANSA